MSSAVRPSGRGEAISPGCVDPDGVGVLELERVTDDVEDPERRSPLLDDVSASTSETSSDLAWLRASFRVRMRLPAPAMTSVTATRPTMARSKRRRTVHPNR